MDIRMPDLNGIDATRQLLADQPGLKVIALSVPDAEYAYRTTATTDQPSTRSSSAWWAW